MSNSDELLTKSVDGDTHSWAFTDAEGIDFEIKHIEASGVISIHECEKTGDECTGEQQVAIDAIDAPKIIAALQAALQLAAELGIYRHDDA